MNPEPAPDFGAKVRIALRTRKYDPRFSQIPLHMHLKVWLLNFLFTGFAALALAQDVAPDTTRPLYRQYPVIPAFSLRRVPDSALIQKSVLPKKKPVLVMLFSPDCDHCQQALDDLKAHITKFKKTEILLVSHLKFDLLVAYYQKHQLQQFPNIIMARDGSYLLGTFYQLKNYPSFFLYNKRGELIDAFEGSVPIEKIASRL